MSERVDMHEPALADTPGQPSPVGAATPAAVEPVAPAAATPTTPPRPLEQWSLVAVVTAVIGAVPMTWPVPILSLMAVGFGLVGLRNCQLDRLWRNRWMAVAAIGIGLATLVTVMLLTALGRIQFLPFWTTS